MIEFWSVVYDERTPDPDDIAADHPQMPSHL